MTMRLKALCWAFALFISSTASALTVLPNGDIEALSLDGALYDVSWQFDVWVIEPGPADYSFFMGNQRLAVEFMNEVGQAFADFGVTNSFPDGNPRLYFFVDYAYRTGEGLLYQRGEYIRWSGEHGQCCTLGAGWAKLTPSVAVPEPSSLTLWVLGGVFLLIALQFRRALTGLT